MKKEEEETFIEEFESLPELDKYAKSYRLNLQVNKFNDKRTKRRRSRSDNKRAAIKESLEKE